MAATTLREKAIASSNLIQPIALWSASSMWARPLSSSRVPVSLTFVFVVTWCFSIAATTVSILKTEPGS